MIRETKNRTKLEEAIPLNTPLVVHVDTNNVCNFKCKFCTTGAHELLEKYERPKGFMTLSLFKKIIDDLAEFEPKVKDLIFHKNGEPLLHSNIVEMIRYANDKKVSMRKILVTNGSLLTPELARGIADSGIDYIQISIEAVSDKGYKEVSNVDISYEKIVFAVGYLFAHLKESTFLNVKIMDLGLSEEEKQKFYDDFIGICHEANIEKPISYTQPDIIDTSLGIKKDVTHDFYESTYKDVCTLPFYTMNINFNGNVSACSFDWRHAHIMGNANNTSLKEIWNGEKYNAFRILQLSKQRDTNEFCNGCEAVYNLIDNIDVYSEEILKRLKK